MLRDFTTKTRRARRLKEQNIAQAPNLRIGTPEGEARGNCSSIHAVAASRDGKLELRTPNSQAGAWELAPKQMDGRFLAV